jgi:hypothetical protein
MKGKVIFRLGRFLFVAGVILFLFAVLMDALVYQSFEAIHTKIIAAVATILLVLFADSSRSEW